MRKGVASVPPPGGRAGDCLASVCWRSTPWTPGRAARGQIVTPQPHLPALTRTAGAAQGAHGGRPAARLLSNHLASGGWQGPDRGPAVRQCTGRIGSQAPAGVAAATHAA